MARRSDFAQKLLDDLRTRKERLASSNSNSSASSTAIIDAYSYARTNYGGTKDIRTSDHMIVPYNNRRSQTSQQHQMGDLAKALAFAIENGGKLKTSDPSSSSSSRISMLSFLHRITKSETRSNNASNRMAFSPTQIKDISKGVCQLNQILQACSNSGAQFDKKSIQIGKELLKGATDLEKSLKLFLVGFGEASECVVKPQRKNRIRLLDDDEDVDDEITSNVTKDWQLNYPRSRLVSLSRSASSLGENRVKPSSSSKARIPNVIAKLMGLENLPEEEIISTPSPKPRETSKIAKKERLLFNTSTFSLVIKDDEKAKTAVIKTERNQDEIGKRKQSLSSQVKRSQSRNVDTEIQNPVKAKTSSQVVKKQKASETGLKSSPSKSSEEKLSNKGLKRESNSTRSQVYSNVIERHNSIDLNSDKEMRRQRSRVMQVIDERAVRVKKEKITKAQSKNELARRNDVPIKTMTRPTRDQSCVVKEVKPTRLEKPKPDIVIKSKKSEANDHQVISTEAEQAFDQCDLSRVPETLATSDDFCQSVSVATNDQLINQPKLCEDMRETKCCIDVANEIDNAATENLETEPEIISEKTTSQITQDETPSIILTESESRVKQIFIKSQLFLNTSESLFKLDIPITTLHNSSTTEDHHYNNNDQSKLILDCGYELMRRKARRQELAVLLLTNPKASTAIRSFNSLVRELSDDFEKLRMYGMPRNANHKDGCYNCEGETHHCYNLTGMQENDVHGKEPDVNCMWDSGWNDTALAFVEVFEVVRDLEKFVLNGLLDEIARDVFLHLAFVS